MKVAFHAQYSKKNIKLEIKEINKPEILGNRVLIKVLAARVNPLDDMISR